ncbi:uncharacterized protein LOC131572877 isoform X2 [Poecile atricapillus]|uniref:uncharacterized protein LOC131572877 isoform X2 n=1 Tax=Poecile atricapillus TaxID=48891 RepID=UPI002738616B|nr:uncharacterized protein LOC131572877 isoform X2 [Poecile atricapillus]
MASFLEEDVSVVPECSGEQPVNRAAAETALPGNTSSGNSSLEPEEPELHLLYLARRAALRRRKCPSSQPGPALVGADGGRAAGPQLLVKSPNCCPEVPADTKRLKRYQKENLPGGLEVFSSSSSHSQQHLDSALSRDLQLPPSSHLCGPSRTSEATSGLLPERAGGTCCGPPQDAAQAELVATGQN